MHSRSSTKHILYKHNVIELAVNDAERISSQGAIELENGRRVDLLFSPFARPRGNVKKKILSNEAIRLRHPNVICLFCFSPVNNKRHAEFKKKEKERTLILNTCDAFDQKRVGARGGEYRTHIRVRL